MTLIVIVLTAVSFCVMLLKHRIHNGTQIIFGIVFPLVVIACVLLWLWTSHQQRVLVNEKLTSILYAIDNYESSDKCFSSEVERQNAIKRLMQSQQELAELETNNKSLDKILGKDKEVEAYVDSAGRMLSAQITRLSRLNPILSDSVTVSSVNDAENILLVGYRKNQNRNIDIAVRCNDSFQEKDSVRILIVVENKEKALFHQCYYFKHGINCFIIPSFNEDVTTYIGYISGLDNVYNRLKLKI